LTADYDDAWRTQFEAGPAAIADTEDENLICHKMAMFAIRKGQPLLARRSMLSKAERGDLPTETG